MESKKLITPPYFLPTNTCLLAITGSESYGISDGKSDKDLSGITFPPREYLFSESAGFIKGFGTPPPNFEVYQEHHIKDEDKEYDLTVYSIVKLFELARVGNPNIIDFLFVRDTSIIHITKAGLHIRDNRKLFLSKDIYSRFRGFAFNHIRNMKSYKAVGKRKDIIDEFSFDVKDASHVVRCMLACQDILRDYDYDVQKHKDMVKGIRRGEWTYEQVTEWFAKMEPILEQNKQDSKLPDHADESALRKVLLECLEIQYGRLDNIIRDDSRAKQMVREIYNICQKGIGVF